MSRQPKKRNGRGAVPGRAFKLTEAMIAEAVKIAPLCMYLETLADALGVHRKTVWWWCQRGKDEERIMAKGGKTEPRKTGAIYFRFWQAFKKAQANTQMQAVGAVKLAVAAGQWQAAMTLLERRWPEQWGRKDRAEAERAKQPPPTKAYIVSDDWSPDDA